MAKKYLLKDQLKEVSPNKPTDSDVPIVEIISAEEFAQANLGDVETREALHSLSTTQNTYLDVYPSILIGSFAVPDKRNALKPVCFAFYLNEKDLIFIDENDTCANLIDQVAQQHVTKQATAAHVLYEFMKLLIKDDLRFLASIEDRMEDIEEQILQQKLDTASHKMLGFRRKLLRVDTYYQQLVDMCSTIAANENKLLSRADAHLFTLLSHQTERLLKRSQTLKEYSFQLRELHQTQIDIKQNDTIQWFTVITTIFVPLTLITSWYGMNFQYMPEFSWPWSYPIIIIVCIVIVIFELRFFKRKKWL